jgi:hypothetical protein
MLLKGRFVPIRIQVVVRPVYENPGLVLGLNLDQCCLSIRCRAD